ncbi:MAG TPA: nicotinate phosphoribosyltransferase [Candidatus Dormibacteraeota bacterium]|nr:nicotinate phosphoribosyltransferase [Candidatus Dormibacteraeota bacterium]
MREYSALLTDLYELTMAAGYFQSGFDGRATFELFIRHLPPHRNYLVVAGLDEAIEFLENVNFAPYEIDYLRKHPLFGKIRADFFAYLSKFRFTGEVWALPEGTLAFPGEPVMRVTAPILEAQILETYLLATLSYSTMIASKAARIFTAAQGRGIVDFSARRAHGGPASLLCARASVVGGCTGTSNTLAGQMFDIATYGTQAHSWIMAHENEPEAFGHFLDTFPDGATLLVDTYNVHNAVKTIIKMGRKPAGIRLDSGDLCADSRWARRELDRAGWKDVKIFASGDLDEYKIAALLKRGAAIDAFGVGTALGTPGDAPHLNLIYKLVEVERGGKFREAAKFSRDKVTYPGRKQVFRHSNSRGEFQSDKIALEDEPHRGGDPLLVRVMRGGKRAIAKEPLSAMRQRCIESLAHLPPRYLQLNRFAKYPVRYSQRLKAMLEQVRRRVQHSAVK